MLGHGCYCLLNFEKWLVHSSAELVAVIFPYSIGGLRVNYPYDYLYPDGVIEQGALMSPNPRGKLEDLVFIVCVCVLSSSL